MGAFEQMGITLTRTQDSCNCILCLYVRKQDTTVVSGAEMFLEPFGKGMEVGQLMIGNGWLEKLDVVSLFSLT